MIPSSDKISSEEKGIHLPLEPLLVLLRNKGFHPKPDDYVEILKVIEEFGSEDMDKVATLICPLVATNEEEQVKFYKVFEAYKQINLDRTPPVSAKKNKWYYALAGILFLGVCGWLIYKAYPRREFHVLPTYTVAVGDTVEFDAYSHLDDMGGDLSDTTKVDVSWDFGEGWTDKGRFKTTHVFNSEGTYYVRRKIKSLNLKLGQSISTYQVAVCKGLPVVNIQPDKDLSLRKGEEIAFSATIEDRKKVVKDYSWQVRNPLNDSISVFHATELKYRFDTTGRYEVMFSAFSDTVCSDQKSLTIEVTDSSFYQMQVMQSGKDIELPTRPNQLVSWLLLIPGIAGIAGSLWYRFLQKKRRNKPGGAGPRQEPITAAGFKPPYEIPFENNDIRLIYTDQKDREVFRSLRQKTEDEIMVLNVPQTIKSTIRSGGYPGAIFTPKLKQREWLVLIDRSNPKSMMVGLFDYMVRNWKEENIAVERFYYTRGFKSLYSENFPTGINIRRLSELYKHSILLLAGTAHELVYSAYPVIDKDLLDELNEWEDKAILSPVSYADWGEKEKVISSYYLLLPADVEGQLPLVSAIRERIYNQRPYLSSVKDRFYEVDWYDFRSVKEIQEYLQHDEALIQWLCAICVFPKLRWEFFVEAGRAILEKYDQTEKLKYSNLLKLCRIKWVQDGSFPEITRLELLKALKVENEIIARETLLRMYSYADDFYKDDFFFREEKDLQQITNQFVLYAHDAEQYSGYKDQAGQFKQLWQKKEVRDGPFRLYMDKKPGDKWTTPVDSNKSSTGINEYFENEDESLKKRRRAGNSIRNIISVISVLLLVIWGLLHLSWNTIEYRIPESWKNLLATADSSAEQYISYVVDTSLYCNDSVSGRIPSADIKTSILNTEGKELASFGLDNWVSMPVDAMINNTLTATISWDEGKKQTLQTFVPSKKEIVFRIQNCPGTATVADSAATRPIRPDSCSNEVAAVLPASLYEIWSGTANRRLLTMDIQRRLIYYSTGDKKTYGTYRVEEVCNLNGNYKLILRAENLFRVFYVRNIGTNNFQLAVCPDFYNSREEVDNITEACSNYDRMQWYYENRAVDACYVPWSGTNYTSDNLSFLQNNISYVPAVNPVEFRVNINSFLNPGSLQLTNRLNTIRKGFPMNMGNRKTDWVRNSFRGTPFDRDNILVQIKDEPTQMSADCNKVYNSLSEASRYPAMVCRLNLSRQKLKNMPKELYNFTNLQELNIRYNSIPLNEIQNFQKQFPKCKVNYDPQLEDNANYQEVGIIYLGDRNNPEVDNSGILNRVTRVLSADSKAKVKLVAGTPANRNEQNSIDAAFKNIKNTLINEKSGSENQIELEVSKGNEKWGRQFRVYGLNFPPNFNATQNY